MKSIASEIPKNPSPPKFWPNVVLFLKKSYSLKVLSQMCVHMYDVCTYGVCVCMMYVYMVCVHVCV